MPPIWWCSPSPESSWRQTPLLSECELTAMATDEVGVFADWREGGGNPLSFTVQAFGFVDKILESFLV